MPEPKRQPAARGRPGAPTTNVVVLPTVFVLADHSKLNDDIFLLVETTDRKTIEVIRSLTADAQPVGTLDRLVFPNLGDGRRFSLVHRRPGDVRVVVFEDRTPVEMLSTSPTPQVTRAPVRIDDLPRRPADPDLLPMPSQYMDLEVAEPKPEAS